MCMCEDLEACCVSKTLRNLKAGQCSNSCVQQLLHTSLHHRHTMSPAWLSVIVQAANSTLCNAAAGMPFQQRPAGTSQDATEHWYDQHRCRCSAATPAWPRDQAGLLAALCSLHGCYQLMTGPVCACSLALVRRHNSVSTFTPGAHVWLALYSHPSLSASAPKNVDVADCPLLLPATELLP